MKTNTRIFTETVQKEYGKDAKAVLKHYIAKGLSNREISEKLNFDCSTISRYCRIYGLSVKKIETPISVVEMDSFNAKIINRDNVLSRRWRCHDI
ncbi:helix-turn-helix domain-containing protein [Fangia hongkongensis]|uniref:helix-turn-helix domain-containing protein n=1 Tax=Fangia hongkongensis TaxID=270495 RepID=UPI000364170F|nr:helix-turn-helix domain-containing protein [Fangia hongkongensis]MBK2124847.1 helix-turn-helix domain-containing protein [Fangia hongkongensis]